MGLHSGDTDFSSWFGDGGVSYITNRIPISQMVADTTTIVVILQRWEALTTLPQFHCIFSARMEPVDNYYSSMQRIHQISWSIPPHQFRIKKHTYGQNAQHLLPRLGRPTLQLKVTHSMPRCSHRLAGIRLSLGLHLPSVRWETEIDLWEPCKIRNECLQERKQKVCTTSQVTLRKQYLKSSTAGCSSGIICEANVADTTWVLHLLHPDNFISVADYFHLEKPHLMPHYLFTIHLISLMCKWSQPYSGPGGMRNAKGPVQVSVRRAEGNSEVFIGLTVHSWPLSRCTTKAYC